MFVRRYAFFDQNIGVILGGDEALVIDTRSTHVQAREVLADLRELTARPVTIVVDTHGHFDHAFGNHVFRPAPIWGHEGCVTFMERTGEVRRARIGEQNPAIAADLAEVVIDPPDRTFAETAYVEVGGRRVILRFLGLGHTDHDIVVDVPGTGVLFAGDLLENGAVPSFGTPTRSTGRRRRFAWPSWSRAWSCPATATTAGAPSPTNRPRPWRRWPSSPAASTAGSSGSTRR